MSKIAKIGIMSFAHMHAGSYAAALNELPEVEFVGIADDEPSRARSMAKQYGVKAFKSYEEMLESDIDGVIVTSENVKHRKHVVLAAQASKHVMCEKPLASTMRDAEAIVDVCKRSQIKLMTAFPCRFHPAFLRLKRAVESSDLGKIIGIKSTNQGMCPGGWFVDKSLSGGGAVIDHTVHIADLTRFLTGAEPSRVYAEIGNRMFGKDFDDMGVVTVDWNNGMFSSIDCSWSRPKSYPIWGNVNIEVTGSEGFARMQMFQQKIDFYSDKAGKLTYDYWGDNIDLALVKSFAKAVTGSKPEITGGDGLRAVEIALAAYESASTGKVINLVE